MQLDQCIFLEERKLNVSLNLANKIHLAYEVPEITNKVENLINNLHKNYTNEFENNEIKTSRFSRASDVQITSIDSITYSHSLLSFECPISLFHRLISFLNQ